MRRRTAAWCGRRNGASGVPSALRLAESRAQRLEEETAHEVGDSTALSAAAAAAGARGGGPRRDRGVVGRSEADARWGNRARIFSFGDDGWARRWRGPCARLQDEVTGWLVAGDRRKWASGWRSDWHGRRGVASASSALLE
jgi:hypothetical protein